MDNLDKIFIKARDEKREIREAVNAHLALPEKASEGNFEKDLSQKLGSFLVDQGYINKIDMWKGSWGCKYDEEEKAVYLNELPMPKREYEYYIVRLGKNSANGQNLFPTNGDETDQYRFLHETSHAYQQLLMDNEAPDNPGQWYDRVLSDDEQQIDSNLGLLFQYCYQKRKENPQKGLSTWGNVPDYNSVQGESSQNATRAIEDANELVTMYLWNPEYLSTFLEYVSVNITGYDETNLAEDKLIKISNTEKESLKDLIRGYIAEMKKNIDRGIISAP